MSAAKARRRTYSAAEARVRLRQAEAYLETARLVHGESRRPGDFDFDQVAAGNAVLAAIAAADAICGALLGVVARGQDHHEAVALLSEVRFGAGSPRVRTDAAARLARALQAVLDLKDESHYAPRMLTRAQVGRVLRHTEQLVEAARHVSPPTGR